MVFCWFRLIYDVWWEGFVPPIIPFWDSVMAQQVELSVKFPPKMRGIFTPTRYKVLYGGRGGGKSWGVARALITIMLDHQIRVLCVRETMNSIKDSVHRLLSDQIAALGVEEFFDIQQASIKCIAGPGAGSEFFFEGIRHNVQKIKSYEGIDICWVEEAVSVSNTSWQILIPTIRKTGSEIWITFNPELATDPTYKRFVLSPPPNSWICEINYTDNPWCPQEIIAEAEYLKETDEEQYIHVYLGKCKLALEGAVYADELRLATKEGRIGRVPYDPLVGVHLIFDIGWSDATAIWFVQRVARETRFIDYYETSRTTIDDDLKECQSRGYFIDTIWLPHDARAKTKASRGLSLESQVRAKGLPVRLIPKLSRAEGINIARSGFGAAYFDQEKCADGLLALAHYKYEVVEDPVKKTFSKEPVHDWSSHGADSFRYASIAVRQPQSRRDRAQVKVSGEDTFGESVFDKIERGFRGFSGWMS